jgi:hypothetical protein
VIVAIAFSGRHLKELSTQHELVGAVAVGEQLCCTASDFIQTANGGMLIVWKLLLPIIGRRQLELLTLPLLPWGLQTPR